MRWMGGKGRWQAGALQNTLSFTFAARLLSTIRNAAMGISLKFQPQPGSSMVTGVPETDMDQLRKLLLVLPFIASLINTLFRIPHHRYPAQHLWYPPRSSTIHPLRISCPCLRCVELRFVILVYRKNDGSQR